MARVCAADGAGDQNAVLRLPLVDHHGVHYLVPAGQ